MNKDGINVLSLFDGVSAAFLALENSGIKINNYYSSEIDESCLQVQRQHYSGNSKFHQIGNVKDVDGTKYLDVDLIIFGSPCTQLSAVNPKDRSGLDGPDSGLFYEALRIIKDIFMFQSSTKHLYFLMENVASMRKSDRDKITYELSIVFPNLKLLKINSALIAPSNRRRLYWTNIKNLKAPKPNDTKFKDVLVNGYVDRDKANVLLSSNVTLTNGIFRHFKMNMGNIIYKDESFAQMSPEAKLELYPSILKESGYNGKAKRGKDEYEFVNGCYRLPSILELERLMTFPDGYISRVDGVSRTEKMKMIGLSFTVDVVAHLLSGLKKE